MSPENFSPIASPEASRPVSTDISFEAKKAIVGRNLAYLQQANLF